jgi:hypothetical protein
LEINAQPYFGLQEETTGTTMGVLILPHLRTIITQNYSLYLAEQLAVQLIVALFVDPDYLIICLLPQLILVFIL